MTTRRPRVLWVTDLPPAFGHGGGTTRQAHLIEGVAERADVHALVAGEVTDERVRRSLAGLHEVPPPRRPRRRLGPATRHVQSLMHLLFERQTMQVAAHRPTQVALGRALASLGDFDVVCVHHDRMAALIEHRRMGRWTLLLAHLNSVQLAQEAALPGLRPRQRLLRRSEERKARRLERWAASAFDEVFVASQEDADAFGSPSTIVPNGVELAEFDAIPLGDEPRVVFTGTLHYLPNVDGLTWFCREVWPAVIAARPDARFDIVGRTPVDGLLPLADVPGVTMHVDVPSVVPFLAAARVAVVPLRLGSGTRLKALEAMATGRPVVGTTIGLEGLGLVDGVHALLADGPLTLAGQIVRLLDDRPLAESIASAGRSLVESRFGWGPIGVAFADRLVDATHRS